MCVGAGFTGFRASGVGRLLGKVSPEDIREDQCGSDTT